MKNKFLLTVLGIALFFIGKSLFTINPPQESHGLKGKLVLTGSSTIAPLALELAKKFESLHPEVRIDVQSGGSSRGISDARKDFCDIGMVSRALKKSESDLTSFTIAQDGICIIAHSQNPINKLNDQQIASIYKGEITNWSEVNQTDAPITVVNKAEGRSTLELFLKYFKLKNKLIKADVVIGDNEQGIKTVAGNPHSIGYVSIGTAEYDATHNVPIKLLPINDVKASISNVANGSFPLSRPLNFVVNSSPKGLLKSFIDFAQSEEVHELVKKQYFVPYASQ